MATAPKKVPLGEFGSDAAALTGVRVTDKMDLVGQPFIITGVKLTRNEERDYETLFVECLLPNTEKVTFTDSSTGVLAQLRNWTAQNKIGLALDEWADCRLFIANGLRFSEFDVVDQRTGKERKAKTFYLSTNGERD